MGNLIPGALFRSQMAEDRQERERIAQLKLSVRTRWRNRARRVVAAANERIRR